MNWRRLMSPIVTISVIAQGALGETQEHKMAAPISGVTESPTSGLSPIQSVNDASLAQNPLSAIRLQGLSATRDRPLFSVSRRPIAPIAAAAPIAPSPEPIA